MDKGRKEEEDKPGNYNGGDTYKDNDNGADGADKEYNNEYNRVKTKNHSNEKDKNYNIGNGENELSKESAFSLPLGLALI
ncbi:hypothetical protein FoTM2_013172 [Fusarium oxysporum f. sp. vasinfectum]|uniref:Uncharacterized protein n=1 Tax=Fusarium oxysporum f. sp. vasinfectum 25433 TaxID=1089449 RepID=X0KZL7_FUSOX|nr:hypothetical protein FOTG_17348 [Fusarium oxysporum f. sp. vasinfectum 25433]KAK2927996.1 hypothetical protein FoTM2_013172 [Fusarium oxysporum f. sp. vasinfectum]